MTFENLKQKLPSLQECDVRYTDAWWQDGQREVVVQHGTDLYPSLALNAPIASANSSTDAIANANPWRASQRRIDQDLSPALDSAPPIQWTPTPWNI